jgi:hypothetical protein
MEQRQAFLTHSHNITRGYNSEGTNKDSLEEAARNISSAFQELREAMKPEWDRSKVEANVSVKEKVLVTREKKEEKERLARERKERKDRLAKEKMALAADKEDASQKSEGGKDACIDIEPDSQTPVLAAGALSRDAASEAATQTQGPVFKRATTSYQSQYMQEPGALRPPSRAKSHRKLPLATEPGIQDLDFNQNHAPLAQGTNTGKDHANAAGIARAVSGKKQKDISDMSNGMVSDLKKLVSCFVRASSTGEVRDQNVAKTVTIRCHSAHPDTGHLSDEAVLKLMQRIEEDREKIELQTDASNMQEARPPQAALSWQNHFNISEHLDLLSSAFSSAGIEIDTTRRKMHELSLVIEQETEDQQVAWTQIPYLLCAPDTGEQRLSIMKLRAANRKNVMEKYMSPRLRLQTLNLARSEDKARVEEEAVTCVLQCDAYCWLLQ